MKEIFFVVFLIIPLLNLAQGNLVLPISKETGKVIFTGIEDVPENSKSKLYDKAKEWIKLQYFTGKDMQLAGKWQDAISENESDGKLIVKVGFRVKFADPGLLSSCSKSFSVVYTIIVYCKDNKYKYEFGDFVIQEFKRGSESTVYFYGFSSTSMNESEVLETPIEDCYPVNKVKNCKKAYEQTLRDLSEEINKKLKSFKEAMQKNDDW